MMFFKVAAIALPLFVFAQGGVASAIGAQPASIHSVATAAGVDLASLASLPNVPNVTTSSNTSLQSLAPGQAPVLRFCTERACLGTCTNLPLFALMPGTCFTQGTKFRSAEVLTDRVTEPDVRVFIAQENCTNPAELFVTDACFTFEGPGSQPVEFITFFTLDRASE